MTHSADWKSDVAHGRGSDPANSGWAEHFSNRPGSNASSQGSFLTGDTYVGKHGRSRRLHGLDPQNNLAASRGIVIHSASYVDPGLALAQVRNSHCRKYVALFRTRWNHLSEIGRQISDRGTWLRY